MKPEDLNALRAIGMDVHVLDEQSSADDWARAFGFTPLPDLYRALEYAVESLAETRSQYASEIEVYGDAWPGALDQIAECEARVSAIRADIGSMLVLMLGRYQRAPEDLLTIDYDDDVGTCLIHQPHDLIF